MQKRVRSIRLVGYGRQRGQGSSAVHFPLARPCPFILHLLCIGNLPGETEDYSDLLPLHRPDSLNHQLWVGISQ